MKCHISQKYIMVILMPKNSWNISRYIISLSFVILALLMIFSNWFQERINSRVIVLLIIAYTPWLSKYIKSFEGFGVKAELINEEQKKEIDAKVKEIKDTKLDKKKMVANDVEIDKTKPIGSKKNPFIIESLVAIENIDDPVQKLVLIRYEMEKKLRLICRINNINTRNLTIRRMVDVLKNDNILETEICDLIIDILPLLNNIMHSNMDYLNKKDYDLIIKAGKIIIKYLEIKSKAPNKYWIA